MMNIRQLLVLLLFAAFIVPSCKNKCDNDQFGIESVQPGANPAGYEIFVKAEGVSSNTKVYFDEVESPSVKTAEGGLIVKVPTNITGVVSLSIEDGECSDSKPFEVLGSYPGNVPASPTNIVIPQGPGSIPSPITNLWKNIFNEDHSVFIQDLDDDGLLDGSKEFYSNNSFFNNNDITGSYDRSAKTITIVIDRSSKPNGSRDTLDGKFIQNIPQQPTIESTILFKSRSTGRQLIVGYY